MGDTSKLSQTLLREFSDIKDLLQEELREDRKTSLVRQHNYHLLQILLDQPEMHPREYDQILARKYNKTIGTDVIHQLKLSNLHSVDRRIRLKRIMEQISISTYNLLVGNSSNPFRDYDDTAKIIRHQDFRRRIIEGKAFLIALTRLPQWQIAFDGSETTALRPIFDTLLVAARQGSYKLCEECARRLLDVLGVEYGFVKRRTSTERVQDVLEDVETTRDLDDMRDTLLIVQREFKHLKEEFEQEVTNLNQEFIRDFFASMNSARYSYLLDAIAQTDQLIAELQNTGWGLEPKLQTIPMIIQIFMNLLRSYGVTPIESVGITKDIASSELPAYEFVGLKNFRSESKLTVIVRTPGWKIGNTIISKPRIDEVNSTVPASFDSTSIK